MVWRWGRSVAWRGVAAAASLEWTFHLLVLHYNTNATTVPAVLSAVALPAASWSRHYPAIPLPFSELHCPPHYPLHACMARLSTSASVCPVLRR